jgi:hypothetical protein
VTVTISVYEKQGLCRGRPIGNAQFHLGNRPGTPLKILSYPGPLTGGATYIIETPYYLADGMWTLGAVVPGYQYWAFEVQDRETHEIWVSRLPA